MTDPLIHIGYHKTATSWLQQQLFVSDDPVFEPLSDQPRGQSTLARRFVFDAQGYLMSPFDFNETAIRRHLEELLETGRFRDMVPVLSHERLSGNPHSSGFDAAQIALRLQRVFPKARILITIREQRDFILSNYFQYLTVGGTHSLAKYLGTQYDGRRPCFSPNHIHYNPLVAEYQRLFEPGRVLVLPYGLFKAAPEKFIAELSQFIDTALTVDPEKFRVVVNRKENHYLMYHLRWLNLFRHSSSLNNYSGLKNRFSQKFANTLFRRLRAVIPNSFNHRLLARLKTEVNDWVGDRYRKANQELSSLIGRDLSEYGYY